MKKKLNLVLCLVLISALQPRPLSCAADDGQGSLLSRISGWFARGTEQNAPVTLQEQQEVPQRTFFVKGAPIYESGYKMELETKTRIFDGWFSQFQRTMHTDAEARQKFENWFKKERSGLHQAPFGAQSYLLEETDAPDNLPNDRSSLKNALWVKNPFDGQSLAINKEGNEYTLIPYFR